MTTIIEVDARLRITIRHDHDTTSDARAQEDVIRETWAARKRAAERIGRIMMAGGLEGRGARVMMCGGWYEMAVCPKGDHRHVDRTSLCRDRLCPQCAAARARRLARELAAEAAEIVRRRRDADWVLLTLTVPDVPDDGVTATVRQVLAGWRQMARQRWARRSWLGWVRRLEATWRGDHHVHLHALIAVPGAYWVDPALYRTQAQYRDAWAAALGRDPALPLIVDVRRADADAVDEVAKYVAKSADLEAMGPDALAALGRALSGARTVEFGGLWRQVRRELGHTGAGDAVDDADAGTDVCPVCGTALERLIYEWAGADYEQR